MEVSGDFKIVAEETYQSEDKEELQRQLSKIETQRLALKRKLFELEQRALPPQPKKTLPDMQNCATNWRTVIENGGVNTVENVGQSSMSEEDPQFEELRQRVEERRRCAATSRTERNVRIPSITELSSETCRPLVDAPIFSYDKFIREEVPSDKLFKILPPTTR